MDATERRPKNKLWEQNRRAKTMLPAQEEGPIEICGRERLWRLEEKDRGRYRLRGRKRRWAGGKKKRWEMELWEGGLYIIPLCGLTNRSWKGCLQFVAECQMHWSMALAVGIQSECTRRVKSKPTCPFALRSIFTSYPNFTLFLPYREFTWPSIHVQYGSFATIWPAVSSALYSLPSFARCVPIVTYSSHTVTAVIYIYLYWCSTSNIYTFCLVGRSLLSLMTLSHYLGRCYPEINYSSTIL